MLKLWVKVVAAIMLPAGFAWGADVSATPYRPTVANPAELSAPGWLELEAGWIHGHGDGVSRQGVPYLAKLAFDEDWGFMLGGELWARDRVADLSGPGDTSVTVKHRMATGSEKLNFGVEAGINLPTARKGLGSGKADWLVTGIASLDFAEDWRLDTNLGVLRQGVATSGVGRVVLPWAACVSHGMGAWTEAGELSGEHQSGAAERVQGLVAISYAVSPRVVLDAGFSHANQGGIGEQSIFAGVTWLAGKAW